MKRRKAGKSNPLNPVGYSASAIRSEIRALGGSPSYFEVRRGDLYFKGQALQGEQENATPECALWVAVIQRGMIDYLAARLQSQELRAVKNFFFGASGNFEAIAAVAFQDPIGAVRDIKRLLKRVSPGSEEAFKIVDILRNVRGA
jgi:hypothetical protein